MAGGLELVELVDFLEDFERTGHFFIREELSFFTMHFDDFFVLQYFLLEIRVVTDIVVFVIEALLILLLVLVSLIGLNHHFKLLLDFVSKVVPHAVLLASCDLIITFAGMNSVSVTEIVVTLSVVVNVGQECRSLVLFTTHESASGLGQGQFG